MGTLVPIMSIPDYTTLHCSILFYIMPQYYTTLYFSLQCHSILFHSILYCTILYYVHWASMRFSVFRDQIRSYVIQISRNLKLSTVSPHPHLWGGQQACFFLRFPEVWYGLLGLNGAEGQLMIQRILSKMQKCFWIAENVPLNNQSRPLFISSLIARPPN